MEDIEILDALNYFSEFLKECLSDNDWTIKHFADLIDCNPQAVGRWKKGLYLPCPQKIIQTAIIIKSSINYMFGLSCKKEFNYCLQNTSFYERYKHLRDLRGYNNYQVARLCDFGNSSVYDWQQRTTCPKVFQVLKLAIKLQGSLDYLFGISELI